MEKDVFTRLCCGECGEVVKYEDHVFLDDLNTVIHQGCYTEVHIIKDRGTFKEIVNKYDFFEDMRIG